MLATEPARNPLARDNMASFHPRGHMNGSTTSFASSNLSSQSGRYGSSSTMRSDYSEQGLYPPMSQAVSSPTPTEAFKKSEQSIMNIRAGEDSSLYQICMNLRTRLATVPGFEGHIAEMEEEEAENSDSIDPVTLMWNSLRRGYPLMTVYNALRPVKPLNVDLSKVKEKDIPKAATFKFLQACMSELKFQAGECFLITDLYGEDTTGFVKVTKVVNKVLDILKDRRLLHYKAPSRPAPVGTAPQIMSQRQRIIEEIVKTERDYVQHLEMLQHFQNGVQTSGAIPGDAVHDIFLNLNQLLDFQRRFLIRIEQQNSLSESEQNWGKLFSHYKDSFRVYEPFIANQNRCQNAVTGRWNELQNSTVSPELQGMVETPAILLGFLVKPFQRLTKYPLLLKELEKQGQYDDDHLADLVEGRLAAQSILGRADEALGQEHLHEAVNELQRRVEDWKGHRIDHFGDLLLNGSYTVLKGEGAKEVEREYKVYLFERILLCCKDINPNKPKNKMLGNSKPLVDKKGKLKLQLKGRIFMQNVTDVVTVKRAEQQSYTIQIFWKGDPGVENFVIRFNDEATMKKWQEAVQRQKKILTESARGSGQTGTSATEFAYLRTQPTVENPYREEEEDYEDDMESNGTMTQEKAKLIASRNTSSTSLRSITGQPGRMATPKYQLPQDQGNGPFAPALSLNTNLPSGGPSPGEFPGNSYFSPTNDSPISTRSSSQQSMHPFPRNQTPGGGWTHEDIKHRTAPAMSRAPSRDGSGPPNSYILNGRTVSRPSLPVMAGSQYTQQQLAATQSRLRSASTPDIHNPNVPRTRCPVNGEPQTLAENVPVPPIPAHMAQMRPPINRSQTTSPMDGELPIRSANQSPSSHRDRQNRQHQDRSMYNRHGQRLPPTSDPYMEAPMQYNQDITLSLNRNVSGIPYPSQLKVTIWFDPHPSHVTIVVPLVIKHRSLIDRIDSKMSKVSQASIANGTARLRYRDSDGDQVTIRSDEDVHIAIEDWGTYNEEQIRDGIVPDFQLFWSKA